MSPASLTFHPEAIEEAQAATRWYRERSPAAAQRFVNELNAVLDSILQAPLRWPLSSRGSRKVKLPVFPYLIIYRVTDDSILILAVAHGRRRPGFWKNRL